MSNEEKETEKLIKSQGLTDSISTKEDLKYEEAEEGDSLRHSTVKISLSGSGKVDLGGLKINEKTLDYNDNVRQPEIVEDLTDEQMENARKKLEQNKEDNKVDEK